MKSRKLMALVVIMSLALTASDNMGWAMKSGQTMKKVEAAKIVELPENLLQAGIENIIQPMYPAN